MTRARELAELAAAYDSGGLSNMKNRIINGAMVIDQRNAGASVSIPSGQPKFVVDRIQGDNSSAGSAVYSLQQVLDAPAGFNYSLKATVTTAATVASGDYQYIRQVIEGFNFADFQFGTANAQTFTLSFWVKSSLTGTFGGYFGAALNARFRTFSYTINSANTWEYKTVVITGDTTGTWVGATNGVGLQVAWSLACGSSYLGATGSWSSSLLLGATGQTNLTPTNGATWFITGVQLEKGSTATSFDYRPYTTELQLCQRYAVNLNGGSSNAYYRFPPYMNPSTTVTGSIVYFPVVMRTVPSMSYSGAQFASVVSGATGTSAAISGDGNSALSAYITFTYSSGTVTTGAIDAARINNNNSWSMVFSAEL